MLIILNEKYSPTGNAIRVLKKFSNANSPPLRILSIKLKPECWWARNLYLRPNPPASQRGWRLDVKIIVIKL